MTPEKSEYLVSLFARRATFQPLEKNEAMDLKIWTHACDLDPEDILGTGLCVTDEFNSVEQTLDELHQYALHVSKTPFAGDKGAGNAVLMETRYDNQSRFREPAAAVLDVTTDVYAQCLRKAADP